MVIKKRQVKYGNFVFYKLYLLKFVGTVFVSSIISSHEINESSVILAKYFPFSPLHVAAFQI